MQNNLVQTLRKYGKKYGIDTSQNFYQAMAETVYAAFDQLDIDLMTTYPELCRRSGCEMIVLLIIGQKMITLMLGDMYCYLTKKAEYFGIAIPLNIVATANADEGGREEAHQTQLQH